MLKMERLFQNLLDPADIKINGDRPWDIHVHNTDMFAKVISGGSLAMGETYLDGWWDCDALDQFFERILRARLELKIWNKKHLLWNVLKSKIKNPYRRSKAFEIGKRHYDIGSDLFECMLDKNMVYSCAYWKDAQSLYEAQISKMDLICRKIHLNPGQRILDIGCGWGSYAKYTAEKYHAEVSGITVSEEQLTYCYETCNELPVKIFLKDYRDLDEQFDHIVSIGMFEHVGYRNYREYMEIVNRCLKRNGIFLLHTIGNNISLKSLDPWIMKYIFPNSMIPSAKQITEAAEGLFILLDWHSFGSDYDKTLMAWYDNFVNNWDKIKDKYGKRFYRMWTYYLLCCAGNFRANKNQLWQIVFTKIGSNLRYQSIR